MNLRLIFIAFLVFCAFGAQLPAQSIVLDKVEVSAQSPLNQVFYDYYLARIDYDQLKAAFASRGNQHFLTLVHPDFTWNLELFEHDIHSPDYVLTVGTDNGIQRFKRKPANKSMIGYLRNTRGGDARMVVADHFIAGMVDQGGESFFIEQANGIDPSLPDNYLVVYNSSKIFQNPNIQCGYDQYLKNKEQLEQHQGSTEINSRSHCLQIEIALANDFSVYQKRGSQANVENWNTTILTLMQANYDNEFAHNLEFVQSASFVATSTSSDPWNGVNNINTHLDVHRSWANGGGYGADFDVATAWTTKYTSGAVGLAWVGVVCTSLKYNVCSDYGGSNNCVRQLQAHEVGHNFAANHDGSGEPYIMAPAVNCLAAWSTASVSSINGHIATRSCLSPCAGGTPPVAAFVGDPTSQCVPFTVQFTDLSANDPTAWQWTFPGGTPSSSTQKNPIVTYKTYGKFDVTLKASNAYGSNQVIAKNYIFAKDKPATNFSKVVIERTVYLTNTSANGGTYEWDFGDGETSVDVNPIHEYATDGTYTITLVSTNECGSTLMKMSVTIVTVPIALFTADTTFGCASFTVKYKNLSSTNVTSWDWEFPGGTPATSKLFEPVVEYKNPGAFDVTLTAKNSKYKAISSKPKYITVDSIPVSNFDFNQNMDTVNFINYAKYAKSFRWEFGDGAKDSLNMHPRHVYQPGSYVVVLLVINKCGVDTFSKTVHVGSGLTAGFKADNPKGCVPFIVQFQNTSLGATQYKWTFPGGTPSTSTDANPVVSYNVAGKYDVSLIAGNGTEERSEYKASYIDVQAFPEADFQKAVSGFTVFFTNQSKFASSYLWNFGDPNSTSNTSTEMSPNHVFSAEGDYLVSLIISNDCGKDTITENIAVYLVPKVDFISDTTVLCGTGWVQFYSKNSSDVNSWDWSFDGASPDHSLEKNPRVYYDKKGNYSVKLSVKNSNGDNAITKQAFIKVISPVLCPDYVYTKNEDLNSQLEIPLKGTNNQELEIFPNPFTGTTTLKSYSKGGQITVKLTNMAGQIVFLSSYTAGGQVILHPDFSTLAPGTYFLELTRIEGPQIKKVLIL